MNIDTIWIEVSCSLPLLLRAIEEQVVDYHGRLMLSDGDDTDICVGTFRLTHLPASYDQDGDTSTAAYVMDSDSHLTAHLHECIERNLHVIEKVGDGVLSVFYLRDISIKTTSNKSEIATALVYRLMSTWPASGIGDVLFVDCIPQDENADELERRRLHDFYREMGFEPLGDSDFLYFPLSLRAPVPEILKGTVIGE